MLSLASSSRPRLTGTRASVNCVIVLLSAVLENLEVAPGEAGDQPAFRVGDRDRHLDDIGTKGLRLLRRTRRTREERSDSRQQFADSTPRGGLAWENFS